MTIIPGVAKLAPLSLMQHGHAKDAEGRYFAGIAVPNVKLGDAVAVPVILGNLSVTTPPIDVRPQPEAVVIAPVQFADAAEY